MENCKIILRQLKYQIKNKNFKILKFCVQLLSTYYTNEYAKNTHTNLCDENCNSNMKEIILYPNPYSNIGKRDKY